MNLKVYFSSKVCKLKIMIFYNISNLDFIFELLSSAIEMYDYKITIEKIIGSFT